MVVQTVLHVALGVYNNYVGYSLYQNAINNQNYTQMNEAELNITGVNSIGLNRSQLEEIAWVQENYYRYFTNWNLVLQYVFVILLIIEDILRLTRFIPKCLEKFQIFNSYIFFSLVFPVALLVAVQFWGIFLFDKTLVWPDYADKLLSFELNVMIHGLVAVEALLLLITYKRPLPRLIYSMLVLFLYTGAYGLLTLETYYETGRWLYPFQEKIGLAGNVLSGIPFIILGFIVLFIGRILSHLIHGEILHEKNTFTVNY